MAAITEIAVSGMSATGTVNISLASGKVQDTVGNPNTASLSADNKITYDVTNTANYLLFEKGSNHTADTLTCSGRLAGDDRLIPVSSVTYEAATFTSNVSLFGDLPVGSYRLLVCGTTSIVDLAGSPLNNGVDYAFDLDVTKAPKLLPATGFAPGRITALGQNPSPYASTDLILEIPSLKIKTSILGVRQNQSAWDVTWLTRTPAGWKAPPTRPGPGTPSSRVTFGMPITPQASSPKSKA